MDPNVSSSSRRRTKRRQRLFGLSAQTVFLWLGAFAVLSMGAVYVLPPPFMGLAVVACTLNGWALYVNDHSGFIRSKEIRRSGEPRRHFNLFEVFVLMALMIGNVFVAVYVLLVR